jgi:peptide/nickel transport system substrate-binding protein
MVNKLAGRLAGLGAAAVILLGVVLWWSWPAGEPGTPPDSRGGGPLVATIRSEPRSFNRLVARDRVSNLVSLLLHGKLVQTNLETQRVEPALARDWSASADGRTVTLRLRKDVRFSDGTPFTADDVLFSLAAAYDERTASPLAGSLQVGGLPLMMTSPDALTVVVTFPSSFGPGVRVLDNLPILPKHKLQDHLAAGTLRDAWSLTTPPADLVGLGPFVLSEYRPGERLVFARNPHYWGRSSEGETLPRLDGLTLLIVPDQNAELLRLESGEAHLTSGELRPEDLASVRRAAQSGSLQTFDVGVGLDADFLWFNLREDAVPSARRWLQSRALRQAISAAVDRQEFANTVYLGAAVPVAGPVTPGNREWHVPDLPVPTPDAARARQLLAAAGLTDRNGDGRLEAPDGREARFSVLTQKGNTLRERSAAFIQQDLGRLGLAIDVVPLEVPALIDRITRGGYEAAYFGAQASDSDPATNLDYWLSSGAFHPWNPEQAHPATPWEERIDALMRQQVATPEASERRRLFREVQRIFHDEMPAIYFVAPRVVLAASPRLTGVRAGLLQPYILWDAASLGLR